MIAFALLPLQAHERPPAALVGTWVRSAADTRDRTKPGNPESEGLTIEAGGRYDSGGFFGWGTWRYEAPRLILSMADGLNGTVAQGYQDLTTLVTKKQYPDFRKKIVLTFVNGKLRLYGDTRYTRAPHWLGFTKRSRPLGFSAREMSRYFRGLPAARP